MGMFIFWRGQLERTGRKPEPFNAEIQSRDGKYVLYEVKDGELLKVSPEEVSGESWMNALIQTIIHR